jgi:hypothetical protein
MKRIKNVKGVKDVKSVSGDTMTFKRRLFAAAAVALFVVGVTALAQGALAQFKIGEAEARDLILSELNVGVGGHANRDVVDRAREAFKSIPPAARGKATTALYAWTKAYVNSAAFKTAYAAYRKDMTPVENVHEGTVEQEVKRVIDGEKAEFEKQIKQLIAAGMKAQADQLRQQGKMFEEKFYQQGKRLDIEEKRAYDKRNYDTALASFNERLPPNPNDAIAPHLRAFVDTTPDVDFTAKQKVVQGGGGSSLGFVNPAYQKKPWQWQLSCEFGPEAIAAARTAASAWLKELGK